VIVFAIIAILVGLAIPEIARTREVFTVTNEAVTIKKGILSKKEHQFHIATITDVNYTQNPWQRLLNYGTLIMTSFSPSGKMIKVGSVDNPAKIMNTINKLVDAKHGKSETEPDVKEKEE
jgi:uncharacterized membrane protein YdbT with pleckstrin-like domain